MWVLLYVVQFVLWPLITANYWYGDTPPIPPARPLTKIQDFTVLRKYPLPRSLWLLFRHLLPRL